MFAVFLHIYLDNGLLVALIAAAVFVASLLWTMTWEHD
jgi:hypothetical protein